MDQPSNRSVMMRKLGSLTSVILVSYFFGLILARFTLPRNHNDAVEEDQLHSLSDSVDTAISPLVAENEQDTPAQGLPVHSAANAFASGDGKLLAGDPGGALRRYESLLAQVPNGVSDPLRYRIALCAESLGKLDRAMNEYKRLASRAAGGPGGVAAHRGQARRRPDRSCGSAWAGSHLERIESCCAGQTGHVESVVEGSVQWGNFP